MSKGITMEDEIADLRLQLKKKNIKIKLMYAELSHCREYLLREQIKYAKLNNDYDQLKNRFEANFQFHGYIKDVLDETADLMESVDENSR